MAKVLAVLLALGFVAPVSAANPRVSSPITLHEADLKRKPEPVLDAWIAYMLARASWMSEHVPDAASRSYSRSFEEEKAGREMLITIWSEHSKGEPKIKDTYLDQLVTVSSAGYLREYVWTYLGSTKWKTRPEGLRLDEFEIWRKAQLPNHRAQTMAVNVVRPNE